MNYLVEAGHAHTPRPERLAVVVLGMHRSGTSALTRMINLLGAQLPQRMIPPSARSNPSGHWESRAIQELNDEVLAVLGSRWDDWRPVTALECGGSALEPARRRAVDLLHDEFQGAPLFVLKDPRICRLLPFWRDVLARFGASPRYVLVWRDPDAVCASLHRRNRLEPAESRLMWLRHVLDAEFHSRGARRSLVSYRALLADWRAVAEQMSAELGITWPHRAHATPAIESFLAQPSKTVPVVGVPPADWATRAAELLARAATAADLDAAHVELDDLRTALDDAEANFSPALAARVAEVRSLEGTLALRDRYVRDLENAARIRDVQLAEAATQLNLADRRIEELQRMHERAAGDDPALSAASRALGVRLLAQRRTLLSERARPPARLPPAHYLGMRLSWRRRLALAAEARALLAAHLFDAVWYLESAPDVVAAGVDPLWHWLLQGWREGRDPNPLFDTQWYLRSHPQAAASGLNPLGHYLRHGVALGHDPGPLFSSAAYLENCPQARAAGIEPMTHWLTHGARELRSPGPWFDPRWYLDENPDVAAAGLPALEHYLLAGGFEGRDPCPGFSSHWYLRQYRDVKVNPLLHFLRHGLAEGRRPRPPPGRYRPGQTADGIFAADAVFARRLEVTEPCAALAHGLVGSDGCGRFSVILPTWNRRESVGAAIDSVLAQSYADWELIVCDDGSCDGTEQLVRERYAEALDRGRLRYLVLPHAGVAAARNAGLRAARGTWIAYLDSDNTWHRHYLLLMAAALAEHRERRCAYACLRVHDEAQAKTYVRHRPFDPGRLLTHNYIDLNVYVHHRALHEQLGGFDESLSRLVDWDLVLRQTRTYEPLLVPYVLCEYHLAGRLGNISLTVPLEQNEQRVRHKHAHRLATTAAAPLRLAWVTPGWPPSPAAAAELDELCRLAVDVRAYTLAQTAPAPGAVAAGVPMTAVADCAALLQALAADQRNWLHGAEAAAAGIAREAAQRSGLAHSVGEAEGIGAAASAQALLDRIARPPLDVFTVTRIDDGDDAAWTAAERSIRSVLDRSSTPLILTIVDDASGAGVRQRLADLARGDERVRLLPLPATRGHPHCANLALGLARSEFVFHLASTDGCVVRHGWERAGLEAMRRDPDLAAAGPPHRPPELADGRSLLRQPWFSVCREPAHARRYPDRALRFVHPGLFVLRRVAFESAGGYLETLPAVQAQQELDYLLQARGHRIGVIPALHAFAAGLDPALDARFDESIVAVCGAGPAAIAAIERCAAPEQRRCNVCGWHGTASGGHRQADLDCPQCGSSARDRAVLRWLTESGLVQTRSTLDARGLGSALRARLDASLLLRDGPAPLSVPEPIPGAPSRALGLTAAAGYEAAAVEPLRPASMRFHETAPPTTGLRS
jgi:hypothetical protein